ncbi:PTS Glc IIA [Lactobacillus kullabergensis]|uniref:PTS Glc IIA n=1 Tax=Lactobacillus kullabergensis TaxID=1218493 RepID=A0A0F4LKV9_9LACO|nr:PTS glucose transporter subunit IIA [Lactobacillus kullabergensis]KJY58206.1 PTS Glc IIA [Lactobacillus kullabergensis]
MDLFKIFERKNKILPLNASDEDIVAMADGTMFDVTKVSDPIFANQTLGNSVAFKYPKKQITICSPANGILTTLFPTGHAFGIKTNMGIEILIHIGINTVNANGNGFSFGKFRQGDKVKSGDPIVTVNVKKLSNYFDMSTILIITKTNNKKIDFIPFQKVRKGQLIIHK